ncbi:MAG: PQQ-binding-like beta-propeller repeat protein [Candidatus Latescibacteria bacterium]|nr:PQQ-binding-like beta-propeller repeat protein [bacterium]MBD3424669.1 PQQ-binding-like beta-propeller repeat protein [Candidatus Latescibacterota bacterium]
MLRPDIPGILSVQEIKEGIKMKRAASSLILAAVLLCSCQEKPEEPEDGENFNFLKLTVTVDPGIYGSPDPGVHNHFPGDTVQYSYSLQSGFSELCVSIDSAPAPADSLLVMTGSCSLTARCRKAVKWVLPVNKAVYYSTLAIGYDRTMYFGTGIFLNPRPPGVNPENRFYAIDEDGLVKWSYPLPGYIFSPVIGMAGRVFVQDSTNTCYAFNSSGALLWSFNDWESTHYKPEVGQRNPAIAVDGSVLVPADGLYALNPASGALRWHFRGRFHKECRASPSVGADGTIYVVIGQDSIYAVNPDGSPKWRTGFQIASEMSFAAPAIDEQGVVYIPSESYEGSFLYAFRADGTRKWRIEIPGFRFVRASPVISPGGDIYIATKSGSEDAALISVSPSGTILWEYPVESVHMTPDDIYSTPSVGSDGLIYFGGETGCLYCVNPGGTLSWKVQLEYGINWSSPVIDYDGTIYIGTVSSDSNYIYTGNIYAVESSSSGYASTPWPTFRHDNQNTGKY